MKRDHYPLLAEMFEYPHPGYWDKILEIQKYLHEHYPETKMDIDQFVALFPKEDLHQMEELFTRSFDVQALTTLDIGYVLFGDDYKRGAVLANLNREHLDAGNDCGTELADHLPNLLRLLVKLSDQEFAKELASDIIAPALSKMISEFDPQRIQKKKELYQKHYKTLLEEPKAATAYQYPLIILEKILRQDFAILNIVQPILTQDFLQSIDKELTIEKQTA